MPKSTAQSDGRRSLGAWGERLAAARLTTAGYSIVARGWRCRYGEMDIIATDRDTLVFCEVRTRRGNARGSAEESITPTKAKRLAQLALHYLLEREEAGDPWLGAYRIDVVAITLDAAGNLELFNHLESAIGDI